MSQNTTSVIDGSTFLISDRYGDARVQSKSRKTDGLFYRDMRHLSTFDLIIRGAPVELLSTNNTNYYAASFFLALDTGSMQRFHRIAEVSVIRHRNLLRVLREEVTLQNHSHREIPIELEIRLPEVFADYDRAETDFPVEYPTVSSPQAWASGTIPLLVRTTLGVRPDPVRRELTTAPLCRAGSQTHA